MQLRTRPCHLSAPHTRTKWPALTAATAAAEECTNTARKRTHSGVGTNRPDDELPEAPAGSDPKAPRSTSVSVLSAGRTGFVSGAAVDGALDSTASTARRSKSVRRRKIASTNCALPAPSVHNERRVSARIGADARDVQPPARRRTVELKLNDAAAELYQMCDIAMVLRRSQQVMRAAEGFE